MYQYIPVLGVYQYIPGMVRTGTYRYLVRTGMYLELVYTGIHLTWYVPVRTNSRYVPVSATVSGHLELPVGVTSQSMMVVDGMWYSVEWCGQNRCCSRELYRYSIVIVTLSIQLILIVNTVTQTTLLTMAFPLF